MKPDSGKDAKEGHRERLREKFLSHGLDKFTDEETIELLLTLNTPRRDVKQAARKALKAFGSLRAVLEADMKELGEVEGIGPKNALGLKLIHQVARKFLRERMLYRPYLGSSSEVMDYLDHSMRSLGHEVFRIIYLSAGNEIINEETVASGTATEVPVTSRQVVERAVKNGAASVVIAHNHPGGDATPSSEDRDITREIVFTCGMMGLCLRDHLIIAPHDHFSFLDEGLLGEYEGEFERHYRKLFSR